MQRLGCFNTPGTDVADGRWGNNSSQSLKRLVATLEYERLLEPGKYVGWNLDAFSSPGAFLAALDSVTNKICLLAKGSPAAHSALDDLNTYPYESISSPKYTFTLRVQNEMRRLGCFDEARGQIDGKWGNNSAQALINLIGVLQIAQPVGWNLDTIKTTKSFDDALKAMPSKICETGDSGPIAGGTCSRISTGKSYLYSLPQQLGQAQCPHRLIPISDSD